MHNSIAVGLGEIKISSTPQDMLVAFGLGSCVGISLYDPNLHLGGLLHAILPAAPGGVAQELTGKYVDTGLIVLMNNLIRLGADRRKLVARCAGGANMLLASGFAQNMNIGTRNVEAAFSALAELKIKVLGQEVGGHIGRTVRFYIADGRMTIRTMGNSEREI